MDFSSTRTAIRETFIGPILRRFSSNSTAACSNPSKWVLKHRMFDKSYVSSEDGRKEPDFITFSLVIELFTSLITFRLGEPVVIMFYKEARRIRISNGGNEKCSGSRSCTEYLKVGMPVQAFAVPDTSFPLLDQSTTEDGKVPNPEAFKMCSRNIAFATFH